MSEKEMPAAEVGSYEFAFHVLPTVAEGEVATVFEKLKTIITKHGGTIITEEAPARFDLAYEVMKYLEGRNRKFKSAYFGWIRFTALPSVIEEIMEEVEGTKELLRHLLTKLTKVEEEHPFYFHESLAASSQKVVTIDFDEIVAEAASEEVDEIVTEEVIEKEDGVESEDKV